MKINNFDNPLFIFLLCIFSIFVNVISSIYFTPVLLLGVLFMAFFVAVKKSYYYSLALIILTVLLIEVNNGFKPLSVILLMTFTYLFVAPYIKRVLSFSNLNPYIYMAFFYLEVYLLWIINNEATTHLNYTILINLIIDFVIFGILI